ncbi:MAG: TRAP transporter large permease subunit [Thiolinea sp.]
MIGLGLLLLVLVLLALRQPLMIILSLIAAYIHWFWGDAELSYLVEDLWLAVDKEALLSIPMFILVGAVMTRGSLASRLIDLAVAATRNMRSGLGVASILSVPFLPPFQFIARSRCWRSGAILYPALIKQGYSKSFSLGALSSGATLGIIIPPSIPLILYGIATETSIVQPVCTAGIIPGLILIRVVCRLFRNWSTAMFLTADSPFTSGWDAVKS